MDVDVNVDEGEKRVRRCGSGGGLILDRKKRGGIKREDDQARLAAISSWTFLIFQLRKLSKSYPEKELFFCITKKEKESVNQNLQDCFVGF